MIFSIFAVKCLWELLEMVLYKQTVIIIIYNLSPVIERFFQKSCFKINLQFLQGMYDSLTILAHSNHKQFSTAGTSLNRAYKDVQIA